VIVLANSHLFCRAWVGAPALVVHSPDRRFEEDADELFEIAEALDDLRNSSVPDEPDLVELHARLLDEYNRTAWMPVPKEIAGHIPCYLSTIFVHRGALPDGWLARSMFPVLALPEETPAIAVLPSRYWPEELVREWREREPTGARAERRVVEIKGYGWPVPAFFVGAIAVVVTPIELATGEKVDSRNLGWAGALAFALAGIAVFLFDLHERRPAPPRYFDPICAHPIDVRFDRRFLFLKPRVWAWICLAFAVFGFLQALR